MSAVVFSSITDCKTLGALKIIISVRVHMAGEPLTDFPI